MKEKYNEIFKLKKMLTDAGIPFYMHELFDGYQICYPEQNTSQTPDARECSVIEHEGSYGHSEDKLEIMGLLTDEELQNDDVVGHLSAEEVFSRIQKHFIENNKMV